MSYKVRSRRGNNLHRQIVRLSNMGGREAGAETTSASIEPPFIRRAMNVHCKVKC